MKNDCQTTRRAFLSGSIKGSLALAALASGGTMLSSFTTDTYHGYSAVNEAEFRTRLALLGLLSLTTAQIGSTKATNEKVKMFATFEVTEQETLSTILKEMGTPPPQLDAQAKASADKLNTASGAAFDKAFMMAQVDTHEKLRTLVSDYVNSSKGQTAMPEMHTRHIASLALATITEHTTRGRKILTELS